MSQLDSIAPHFAMAARRWGDAANLRAHYEDLARTFDSDGCSSLELAKSFIESVCITLLNEFGQPVPLEAPTTQYLRDALQVVGLSNTRGTDKFDKVLSAFNKLSDGLSDVRNQDGSVAHGKDGFLDTLTTQHARVFVLTADMIVSLLMMAYDGTEPSIRHTRDPHVRFRHLNDRIDRGMAMDAEIDDESGTLIVTVYRPQEQERSRDGKEGIEIRVAASELLYALDRQAYIAAIEKLRGLPLGTVSEVLDEAGDEETSVVEQPVLVPLEEPTRVERVATYEGRFSEHLIDLSVHLQKIGGSQALSSDHISELAATMLKRMEEVVVVDWKTRSSTLASVRLAIKRSARLFSEDFTDEQVQAILEWLVPTIRKPFDVLAEGLLVQSSRGDKTAIELFIAGVHGWEAGLRRLFPEKSDGHSQT